MKPVKIAAVVVTYKTKALLENCLKSLYTEMASLGCSCTVTVVDNASNDGTAEMVREKFPEALLQINTENLGPARGFNRGISGIIEKAENILVLNSDIEILPGTLRAMLEVLENEPDVDGVSGPLLNEDHNRQMIKTHIWRLRPVDFEKRFRIEFVGTTFALIRAATFHKIGGYDENYYFHNEDLDWAVHAKREGYRFMYLPDAPVIHFQSKGKIQNQSRIIRETYWSDIYFYKKFYPRWAFLAYGASNLNLDMLIRSHRSKLKRETNPEKQAELSRILADYIEAKERMKQEYHTNRPPKVPQWN